MENFFEGTSLISSEDYVFKGNAKLGWKLISETFDSRGRGA